MKKILAVGIIVVLLGSLFIGVAASVAADTVPPTIANMRRLPSSVLVGDPITITCTCTDDMSGVKNVSIQIKDAKYRVVNYTMTAAGGNTYTYTFNYTGKEGLYYIQYFRSYDNASNSEEKASTLNFTAWCYSDNKGAGGEVPTPSPTPDMNATATPLPPPPTIEWIRHPGPAISGRDVFNAVGLTVCAVVLIVLWCFLWRLNENIKWENDRNK